MDVSLINATGSGAMTIEVPYDDTALPAGVTEANLSLLHYTGSTWEIIPNITIDVVNNKISATITSLSPYSAGASVGTVSTTVSSSGGTAKTMYTSGDNFEWSLEINGKRHLLDKFTNVLPIHRTYVNMPVNVTAAIYDTEGSSDVEMVGLYMCLDKMEIFSNADCYVEYYSNGNKAIYDPNGMFTLHYITTKTIDGKLLVTFDVTFDKPVYSSMAIQSWDTDRDFILRYIPDSIEVLPLDAVISSKKDQNTEIQTEDYKNQTEIAGQDLEIRQIQINTIKRWSGFDIQSATDVELFNSLGIKDDLKQQVIPSWTKTIGRWVVDDKITVKDFIESLKFLIQKNII